MKTSFFENLNFNYGERCLIFLDIDGTLVPDGEWNLGAAVLKAINNCKRKNEVYLCTNSSNEERSIFISEKLKLPLISGYRKPSRKILSLIPKRFNMWRKVVIGDKLLTDGIFAYRIGAQFVKVKRKVGNDRVIIKLYNFVDDFIGYLIRKK